METPFDMMHHLAKAAPIIHFPIYWTDLNSTILGTNQAFLEVMGVRGMDEVLNKTLDECFPECMAQGMSNHVKQVIETKQTQICEEEIQDISTGIKRCFTSTRSPLMDIDGNVFGVIGTTVELTAERYAHTNQMQDPQLMNLKNKEAFMHLAHKVAHDIQSPLTALSVMLNNCDELSETKRLIFKNAFTALKDIANNILNKYTVNEQVEIQDEERRLILCSDFLLKLVSERKCQYQNLPVKFEMDIASKAQFAFIRVQSSQFGRAISNIINNAVDALKDTIGASVAIKLEADDEFVKVQIKDNGKGMPPSMIERLMSRKSFTAGKENGHGLGMMQVWDMVDFNEAKLTVTSQPGQGTTFELMFARTEKADWVVDEINIRHDDIVVILDDDQLIHDAWDLRIKPLLQINPELHIRHERNGQAAIDYIASLSPEDKKRVYLFCDFELINQELNGLNVIEACKLERSFLVTSYYYMPAVQKSAVDLGIKVLPKQMALVTPLYCTQRYGILRINVDHVVYDKHFYSIDQLLEMYGERV